MTHAKTMPPATGRGSDRWTQVAFLSGKLAARSGAVPSTNPHPAGSDSAKGWQDGWQSQARAANRPPPVPSPVAVLLAGDIRPLRLESELTMDLLKRLPDMADADLGTLGANAERLALNGNAKQKTAAQAALPAIQEELATRQARKAAATAATKAAGRGRRKAAVVAAAEAASESA
ncbi:hypothetical protein [Azospirillum doebereinerae]